uniref:Uncharacterized protein n=1 Tax=Linum usitatissimum TaxID=4006 RepID=I6XCV2_LINUS|nr:hypothetical protein [Linum usitatissimum]
MKASLKFRDEQNPPLFRGKIPLNILGFPFQSGIVAGDSKELSLNLSTYFDSGPSLKVSYRPNDSRNPFSLVVKTGTGDFGSPISSPFVMSAEFNLIGNGNGNPRFMLHFKPRLGDFSIKKSQTSVAKNEIVRSWRNGVVVNASPDLDDGSLHAVELEKPPENGIGAKRVPVATNKLGSGYDDLDWMINFKNIPLLVMNKMGIELVDKSDLKSKSKSAESTIKQKPDDVAAVNRQLEMLQRENELLKRGMDDLRHEIGGRNIFLMQNPDSGFNRYREEADRNQSRNPSGNRIEKKKKQSSSVEEDVSEELKKALKVAANCGP